MDINVVLKEFDTLFRQATPDEIHGFLTDHIRIAEQEGDLGALLLDLAKDCDPIQSKQRREEAWMDELTAAGKNLPAMVGELTAQAYGYSSVEEADKQIYSLNNGVE